ASLPCAAASRPLDMSARGTTGDCPPTWPFEPVCGPSASLNFVIELTGDSSRAGDWACVRLRVEGGRVVAAGAEGMTGRLDGLPLLEAAAAPGEQLAADALANAIGPAFRAAPSPKRAAVAMSGGVDSAVALLRAGRDAIGVTLRLWLDPHGPAAER